MNTRRMMSLREAAKAVALGVLLVASACSNARTSDGPERMSPEMSEAEASPTEAMCPSLPPGALCTPETPPTAVTRLAVLLDYSGSTQRTFTPQVTAEDLRPALEIVGHGGELAVGLITDRSTRSLLRLRVEPFTDRAPSEPRERNPLRQATEHHKYCQQLERYCARWQEWKARRESDLQTFQSQLVQLLNHPANAPRTDICTALFRADLFLNEPGWSMPVRKILLVVSDGQDNVGSALSSQGLDGGSVQRRCPPLTDAETQVLVVTGWPDLGVLAPLHPVRFESVGAALQYLVSEVKHEKQ